MNKDKSLAIRSEENSVCFTGHRIISTTEIPKIRRRLQQVIRDCYGNGYRWFICGGALGFDTLAALEILELKREYPDIGLYLAIPCADQASRWNDADRTIYDRLCDQADDRVILSERYFNGCMHIRNQFMVRHAAVCVCYLRRFAGGTGYTVRYALSCHRKIINLCNTESGCPARIKEPSWNSIFTSPFVYENVRIARSIPFQAAAGTKWKHIRLRYSGKRLSEKTAYRNR